MGAERFEDVSTGKTASEAFLKARDEAAYEHGHGGYSGTIAEKDDFVLFDPAEVDLSPREFLALCRELERKDRKVLADDYEAEQLDLAERAFKGSDDKWGPAAAMKLPEKDKRSKTALGDAPAAGERAFVFWGWASA